MIAFEAYGYFLRFFRLYAGTFLYMHYIARIVHVLGYFSQSVLACRSRCGVYYLAGRGKTMPGKETFYCFLVYGGLFDRRGYILRS